MEKRIIEYDIPIQDKEQCDEHNEKMRKEYPDQDVTQLKSTEEHMLILFEKLRDTLYEVGDEGGWYIGDGIKVKIEMEYDPEDK